MIKTCAHFLGIFTMLLLSRAALSQPQPVGRLESLGLSGRKVSALALPYQITPAGAYLYAGTSEEGVWRLALTQSDTAWEPLGLEGKEITALDVHVWGAGPAIFYAPVAGITPKMNVNDSVLVYRLKNGKWLPMDSGMARSEINRVRTLNSFESSGHAPPATTFAGGDGLVYRSSTASHLWEQAYTVGVGLTNAIAVQRLIPSNEVWAGGETAIFAPWIAKSQDEGKTWEVFYPDMSGDNACDALAVHPNDSDIVYAGMEGAVLKTADGGKTWNKTALANTPVYFYGLALDAEDPDHVFAGGTIANPNSWAMWESFDGGATWREIAAPQDSAENFGIRSIIADPTQAGVIYIATFGRGVWKYQSSPTDVNDPPSNNLPNGFVLAQNAPNPFARNETPATVIRYQIPATQHIKVEIYDLLGRRVATLVDRVQASGEYAAQWNGKDLAGRVVPNGIYFYRLRADAKTIAMRKMIMIR